MRISTKKINKRLTLLLVTALFAGHAPVFAETADNKELAAAQHEKHTFEWPGIYNGFLPCADCIGLKTSLALNTNGTYIYITQYVGKSPRDFVEKGKYDWNDKTKVITLTPRNGTTSRQYLAGDNQLKELDANGVRMHRGNEDKYTLRRVDVTANPPDHSH